MLGSTTNESEVEVSQPGLDCGARAQSTQGGLARVEDGICCRVAGAQHCGSGIAPGRTRRPQKPPEYPAGQGTRGRPAEKSTSQSQGQPSGARYAGGRTAVMERGSQSSGSIGQRGGSRFGGASVGRARRSTYWEKIVEAPLQFPLQVTGHCHEYGAAAPTRTGGPTDYESCVEMNRIKDLGSSL